MKISSLCCIVRSQNFFAFLKVELEEVILIQQVHYCPKRNMSVCHFKRAIAHAKCHQYRIFRKVTERWVAGVW